MEQRQTDQRLTVEEYHQLEEEMQQRYEYHDGEVFAMAGGDPVHNAIGVNVTTLLNQLLREKNCNVFNSDQKVWIQSIRRSLYPDASVTCGPVERSAEDKKSIMNPVLLVEVLSDSTEAKDRGKKFEQYSQLPTLQEYVLISQYEPSVQVFYRASNTHLWQISWITGLDQILTLQSLEIEMSLEEIYFKTEDLR